MSSVNTPGSDSLVVHSMALERGAARTAAGATSSRVFHEFFDCVFTTNSRELS
jgi:hypothetical protein